MEEYSYELKIPKDRIAVLIGKKGEVKAELEAQTDCRIQVDSKEGDVVIRGVDTLKLFMLKDLVTAIGRGFSPERAQLLLKTDYVLEVIPVTDYAGEKRSHLERLKGRIIGSEGKARKNIEEITETFICVYGKTVSIIGNSESVAIARRAVDSLLQGSPHSAVYKYLERWRRDLKNREMFS